mgnify:CR=1 FL=1
MAFQPRIQDDMRHVNFRQWQEGVREPETREQREDYSVRMKKSKQKEGLPFE